MHAKSTIPLAAICLLDAPSSLLVPAMSLGGWSKVKQQPLTPDDTSSASPWKALARGLPVLRG